MGVGVIGRDAKGGVEIRQRIVVTHPAGLEEAAIAVGLGVVRLQRDRAIVGLPGLRRPLESRQRGPQIVLGLGMTGVERDGRMQAGDRVVIAPQLVELDAGIVVNIRVVGLQGGRAAQGRQRLFGTAEFAEHPAPGQGAGEVRLQRQGRIVARQGLIAATGLEERQAKVAPRRREGRVGGDSALEGAEWPRRPGRTEGAAHPEDAGRRDVWDCA